MLNTKQIQKKKERKEKLKRIYQVLIEPLARVEDNIINFNSNRIKRKADNLTIEDLAELYIKNNINYMIKNETMLAVCSSSDEDYYFDILTELKYINEYTKEWYYNICLLSDEEKSKLSRAIIESIECKVIELGFTTKWIKEEGREWYFKNYEETLVINYQEKD